jgi:hypothetical protein
MANKKQAPAATAGQGAATIAPAPGGLSKMGMVREALGTLGTDAKPKAIGEFVKAKHGTEIPPQVISAYKSNINGAGSGKSRVRIGGGGGGISLGDLEDVKALVNRVGAKGLSDLVHVLAK